MKESLRIIRERSDLHETWKSVLMMADAMGVRWWRLQLGPIVAERMRQEIAR